MPSGKLRGMMQEPDLHSIIIRSYVLKEMPDIDSILLIQSMDQWIIVQSQ